YNGAAPDIGAHEASTPPMEFGVNTYQQKIYIKHIQKANCRKAVQIGYEAWLICRNVDASKKILMATEILVFDFELFVGGRRY
ncbi:MAG: hypothetical protein HWN69_09020, partial [Desulfobacterales bacterium]|nr:hypothetical protein [Desulfobacterales bacterium]